MLRREHLAEVIQLDTYFSEFFRKVDTLTGLKRCEPLCNLNKPFKVISSALNKIYQNATTENRDELLLDYPMSIYQGAPLFVGMNMIDVEISGGCRDGK